MLRKHIANIISFSRIIGSVVLLATPTFSKEFFALYTYCGLSDALDGYVARKLHIESKFGLILDSISDILFFLAEIFKVWSSLQEALPKAFFILIYLIIGIRLSIYLYVYIKERKLACEHSVLNKVTGLLLFFIPYIIKASIFVYYAAIVILVAMIAAIYEYRYHLTRQI